MASMIPSTAKALTDQGFRDLNINQNLAPAALVERVISGREGVLTEHGALLCITGKHTGRSPRDKYFVGDQETAGRVDWGDVNQELTQRQYQVLRAAMADFLKGRDVFVQDCFVGADPGHRLAVRTVTQYAWHALFARNMFLRPTSDEVDGFQPGFHLIAAPGFSAKPKEHGTRSSAFVVVSVSERTVLIGGTRYAGEIKKAMFSVMNYLLPPRGVLTMHCSANVGHDGDVALFFGLSGTGKTTLSADPQRRLIGDDEHGWGNDGVFNLEGGCYAKAIRLSAEAEPEIFAATRRFGTILENVVMDPQTRRLDLDSEKITENTRVSYEVGGIPNAVLEGRAGHPRNVVFLTCDAFGVLPPISKLTPQQAAYHFLSGYTAKVAGTEIGVKEPQATFSTCFGAAFMPLHPGIYAKLLAEKIARHEVQTWMINTGWIGGPYGTGTRIKIALTRQMLRAALAGVLQHCELARDPIFGVEVPRSVPGIPEEVLDPRATWTDKTAYERQARHLAELFEKNFERYSGDVDAAVRAAAPRTS